jgi:hypothetical protein
MPVLGGSRVPSSPELRASELPEDEGSSRQRDDAQIARDLEAWPVAALVWVALSAVVLGRALAPALPGSNSGIARWITLTDRAAAIATQLLVLVGTMYLMRLIVGTLRARVLPLWYRLLITVSGAAVVTVAIGAAGGVLQPDVTVAMGICSASAAIGAAAIAVRPAETRAGGLIVALQGVAALVQLVARALALFASEQAMTAWYQTARQLSTAAFMIDAASIALTLVWLSGARVRRALTLVVPIVLLSVGLSWSALRGSFEGAPVWQVVLARAFGELARPPIPLVVPVLRYWVESLALITAVAVLVTPGQSAKALRAALALALLCRASTDVPALALLLLLAACLLALATRTVESAVQNPPAAAVTT